MEDIKQQLQECEQAIARLQNQEVQKIVVKVPGAEATVTKEDSWQTVSMVVVAILAIYLGIKLINKYVK